jgi:hypothetical protein
MKEIKMKKLPNLRNVGIGEVNNWEKLLKSQR